MLPASSSPMLAVQQSTHVKHNRHQLYCVYKCHVTTYLGQRRKQEQHCHVTFDSTGNTQPKPLMVLKWDLNICLWRFHHVRKAQIEIFSCKFLFFFGTFSNDRGVERALKSYKQKEKCCFREFKRYA